MEFTKGHGTGNDFVIIPDPENRLVLSPKLVSALCDRRFGIGGDGVLRVVRTAADPALPGDAEWFMDYRNADGSIAEICGNGVRVFARYLVASELVATPELVVGTRAGPVIATVSDDAVSVSVRPPRVYGESTARLGGDPGRGGGRTLSGWAVDCGNPHLVCPLPADLDLAGLDLTAPPEVDEAFFPDGVNVEFTAPGLRMRVYERGVGETLSCGSGACAAAAVALHTEGRDSGVVIVDVPGGRLTVSLTPGGCALTGAAVLVAEGIYLAA